MEAVRRARHRAVTRQRRSAAQRVPDEQITLLIVIVLAFAAGYGLRAFISYRRRHRWD